MARLKPTGTWLVVVTAFAMLTMTMPTMATHNSVGQHVYVLDARENVDENGDPIPDDIPEDMAPQWHTGEVEDGLIPEPRSAPQDQRGSAYMDEDCTTYGEDNSGYLSELDRLAEEVDENTPHEDRDTSNCWVGYMSSHRLAFLATTALVTMQSSDLLYGVNPSDDYCSGEEGYDDEDARTVPPAGVEPVDQTVANVERVNVAGEAGDEECSGAGHEQGVPGQINIDNTLLETPFQGGDTPGASEVTGLETASGTHTLPTLKQPYVLLFGQPHPSNEDPSPYEAGSGPFGDAPGDPGSGPGGLSTVIGDLTGVCADRTQECKLLTPTDVQLYDTNPTGVEGDEGQARMCYFSPQFSVVNPDDRSAGLCGLTGSVIDDFVGFTELGGLGVDEAPGTFLMTLPGWHIGLISIDTPTVGSTQGPAGSTPDQGGVVGAYFDDEPSYNDNYHFIYAVNPTVPTGDHPLWCIEPGMLSEGGSVTFGDVTVPDPGLYGPYDAAALTFDLHPFSTKPVYDDVLEATHEPVRGVLGPVQDAADEGVDAVNELLEDTEVDTPPEVDDALNRTGPGAPGFDKGYFAVDTNPWGFDVDREEGIGCNAAGQIEITEEATAIPGGVAFDTGLSQETVALKDPTFLDEEGLPEDQADAHDGTWQADLYSFNGDVRAIMDTNENGDLDDCPTLDGSVPSNADTCVWEPYWDVYNPACNTFGSEPCIREVATAGYAPNATTGGGQAELPANDIGGVGLFFGLQVAGPTLITDTGASNEQVLQERTAVLGAGDPTATHCVIGTSIGFDEFLLEHVTGETGEEGWQEVADEFCPDYTGELFVVTDAFNDQGSLARGSFSSAIEWAPLAPSPALVQDNLDGFGEDEGLCVGGLWSVQEGVSATEPTEGNLDHNAQDATYVYGECLDLSTTSGDNAPWTPGFAQ